MAEQREVRQVTDSRVLAAMSHPLRRRLLDVLLAYGPQPVGSLAAHTDQAPANVSHHMRVLAESRLVEEAPELARDRREHWWRPVSRGLRWSSADFIDDPAAEAVMQAAESLNLDRHVDLVRQWYASSGPGPWSDNAFAADRWLHLTPDELGELSREIVAVFDRWSARRPSPSPDAAEVFVFAHGIPARP
jgi:DNA-binding transcriptional ArsR family regulator